MFRAFFRIRAQERAAAFRPVKPAFKRERAFCRNRKISYLCVMAKESMEKLEACAAALRRHHFDAVAVGSTAEAFDVMKAAAEACRPRLASFGDSMTMRATGILEWLAGNDEVTLLDGFDASKPYAERLEIRRQALMSDLFVTGVNAVTEA